MPCSPWCPMKGECIHELVKLLKPYGLENAQYDEYRDDKEKIKAFRADLREFCWLEQIFKDKVDELLRKHDIRRETSEEITTRYDLAKDGQ